jgi:hypothetical protein
MIRDLVNDQANSYPFLEAVNWEGKMRALTLCIALGLIDYPQVIKRPMDLDTIKVRRAALYLTT